MSMRRGFISGTVMALLLSTVAVTPSGGAVSTSKTYTNCNALNRTYPHGVGRPGARDKPSGHPVTNFKVSKTVYQANRSKDRDRDGIACEKK